MWRTALLVVMLMVAVSPEGNRGALAAGDCPPDQAGRFAAEFVPLLQQLGPILGQPTDCARLSGASGDLIQPTTTGFAYRYESQSPSFTNGHEFWALGPEGVEHWSGTLHEGLAPPQAAAAEPWADLSIPPAGTYPSLIAATVTDASGAGDGTVVVQYDASSYAVRLDNGCFSLTLVPGQTVFIRLTGPFTGPGATLIVVGQGACSILQSQPS